MCECVNIVNRNLLNAGTNTKVKIPLLLNPDLTDGGERLQIVTEKVDKKARGTPQAVFSTYCPFCGEKHSL